VTESIAPEDGSRPSPSEPRKRRRWGRRLAVVALVMFVAYTLGGFFGVPAAVRHVVTPRLSKAMNGAANVGPVSFNPFTFALAIEQGEITDAAGEAVIAFGRFETELHLFPTLFGEGLRLAHVRLHDPTIGIELSEDRSLNLLGLFPPSSDDQPTALGEVPRVVVEDLAVTGGAIDFADRALGNPVETYIEGLNFTIDRLDTAPSHDNPHELVATIREGGGSFALSGEAYIDPLTAAGSIVIEGVQLATASPYAVDFAGVAIDGGTISAELSYSIAPTRTGERLSIDAADVSVSDLLLTRDERRLGNITALAVNGITADVDEAKINVESVGISGARASVRREADGEFELLALLPSPDPPGDEAALRGDGPSSGSDAATGPPDDPTDLDEIEAPLRRLAEGFRRLAGDIGRGWDVALQTLEVSDTRIDYNDVSTPKPVAYTLSNIELSAGPSSTTDGLRTPFKLAASGSDGASIDIAGTVDPSASSIDVAVAVEGLTASPFTPYTPSERPEGLRGVALDAASLGLDGDLTAIMSDDRAASTWDGRLTVADLATSRADGEPPLTLESLALSGVLDAELGAQAVGPSGTWSGELSAKGLAMRNEAPASLTAASIDRVQTGSTSLGFDLSTGEPTLDLSLGLTADGVAVTTSDPTPGDARLTALELEDAAIAWRNGGGVFDAERLVVREPRISGALAERVDRATSATESDDALSTTAGPLEVRLRELVIADGDFALEDRSIDPPLAVSGTGLQMTVQNIDTSAKEPASIELSTGFADVGRVVFEGKVDPFRAYPSVDATIALNDVPVRPFTPVLTPLLGYDVRSGRIGLRFPMTISDGQLEGSVDATLSSFYLGEKVPSDDATDLPVKLGLSLLRDGDDAIRAELDVSGDLTAPDVTIGRLVWKAATNLIGGVASAPFKLIGRIVGAGNDVNLSSVEFEAGERRVPEDADKTLKPLAEALRKRPTLGLSVVGVTGKADAVALRAAELEALVAARAISVDEGARTAALREIFAERFPELSGPPVPVPPGRLDQALTPPAEMREKLLATIEIGDDELETLALQRAETIAATLTEQYGIEAERVQVIPLADAELGREIDRSPRVEFELLSVR